MYVLVTEGKVTIDVACVKFPKVQKCQIVLKFCPLLSAIHFGDEHLIL